MTSYFNKKVTRYAFLQPQVHWQYNFSSNYRTLATFPSVDENFESVTVNIAVR